MNFGCLRGFCLFWIVGWFGLRVEVRYVVREKEVEQKLVEEVKKRGGIAPKWVSPGMSGVPDRLILLPKGKIGFAETKAPGGVPRPLQKAVMRKIGRLGFPVFVVDRKEGIGRMLDEIEKVGKKNPQEKAEKKLPEIAAEEKLPEKTKMKKGGDAD